MTILTPEPRRLAAASNPSVTGPRRSLSGMAWFRGIPGGGSRNELRGVGLAAALFVLALILLAVAPAPTPPQPDWRIGGLDPFAR